jgi:SAM-dependent methyltransferase
MMNRLEEPPESASGGELQQRHRQLEVGCGKKKPAGAIGLDLSPDSLADVRCDVTRTQWPLRADSFDVVSCQHVIEHVDDVVAFMAEIHRVARDGARVVLVTPHFSSVQSWEDPTHRHHFALYSFDMFADEASYLRRRVGRFRVISRELGFGRSMVNILPRFLARRYPRWYERRFPFLFPARNIRVELEVLKRG